VGPVGGHTPPDGKVGVVEPLLQIADELLYEEVTSEGLEGILLGGLGGQVGGGGFHQSESSGDGASFAVDGRLQDHESQLPGALGNSLRLLEHPWIMGRLEQLLLVHVDPTSIGVEHIRILISALETEVLGRLAKLTAGEPHQEPMSLQDVLLVLGDAVDKSSILSLPGLHSVLAHGLGQRVGVEDATNDVGLGRDEIVLIVGVGAHITTITTNTITAIRILQAHLGLARPLQQVRWAGIATLNNQTSGD